ncbi:N-acetylmuramoyl-L-alanine amidase [Bdellovibrionota bacterium FG-1]
MKTAALATVLISLVSALSHAAPAKKSFLVVLDPGHGGSDFGAIHKEWTKRTAEKDLALLLAQETARQLRTRGILVTLTRTKDEDMSLTQRTSAANRVGADVFVSIHVNATPLKHESEASGIETYILNNATDATSKRLAYLENSENPVLAKNRGDEAPQGTDVALILKDLRLDANLPESKRLACSIQGRLVHISSAQNPSARDRGVRQALFYVLLGADMPSVLVEAGFMGNPKDRQRMLSPAGRKAISVAIASAIDEFRTTRGSTFASALLSRCKVH